MARAAEDTLQDHQDYVRDAAHWPVRMLAGHEADAWDLPLRESWSFPVRGAPS
jgi:hypothetical protein